MPYTIAIIIAGKPIEEVTFAEAAEWMNSPTSIAERVERRFLLKQYIGASLNFRNPELKQGREGG